MRNIFHFIIQCKAKAFIVLCVGWSLITSILIYADGSLSSLSHDRAMVLVALLGAVGGFIVGAMFVYLVALRQGCDGAGRT